MKKYIIAATALCSAMSFCACDDMLDTDPRVTEATTASFPTSETDANALNAATYAMLNALSSSPLQFPPYMWSLMSDDCYGSGGVNDSEAKALHHFTMTTANMYEQLWKYLYGGIFRANTQIETIDNFTWGKAENRAQILGEGYYMRALYTLWLTQCFGDVPLVTSSAVTPEMEKQVSAQEVIYPQILSDLYSANHLLGQSDDLRNQGRATKGSAAALLARAYMFFEGFYNEAGDLSSANPAPIALVAQEGCPEGTNLSKGDVVTALEGVTSYSLRPDYRSLWQYSNSIVAAEGWSYTADMKESDYFDAPGNGNGNTECLFAIQYMNRSNWNMGKDYFPATSYSNENSLFWGLRTGAGNGQVDTTYPFGEGWGMGTPSKNIWDDWSNDNDLRKKASVLDCVNDLADYRFATDDCEESGYAVKKYLPVIAMGCANGGDTWWSLCPGYAGSSLANPMQGDHFEDFYIIRYSDVLLMLTELTGNVQYQNQVRERAGLEAIDKYSWAELKNDRRFEFAFEGIRFNDLRRYSGINNKYSDAIDALNAQAGKVVTNHGGDKEPLRHQNIGFGERYKATKGFVVKPATQITLQNGDLIQNEGWEGDPNAQYELIY